MRGNRRAITTVTTPLEGPLKREIEIGGAPYTLTITPDGMTLVRKGRRKGFDMRWRDLVSGEAALATALNASLTARFGAPHTGKRGGVPAGNRGRR
jgi:hypothetical protein